MGLTCLSSLWWLRCIQNGCLLLSTLKTGRRGRKGAKMPKAIEKWDNGWTVGHAALGFRSGAAGSVRQETHDGDTINVRAIGNLGIRFLGVDAPEISFKLPGPGGAPGQFLSLGRPEWNAFLADPFDAQWPPFDPPLSPGLQAHLANSVGQGAALNHRQHAEAAEDALEQLVEDDMAVLGQTEDSFRFFLVFAHEVTDIYGRLLCFINREQPNANQPAPRPRPYNERLLEAGMVGPYLIWPNVDPWRTEPSLRSAVIQAGTAHHVAQQPGALRNARNWVAAARAQGIGIFGQGAPLRLQPSEVRFLARRCPPNRWVIDLGSNSGTLVEPQNYYTIANLEDRLYIPDEYVPLFVEEGGWQVP